ncbi:hypothetical protein DFJ58DRAFT_799614 [Suillus subalutaceus]|uniref:uncharacterized protein n=1 Tax=Suillus subalutaceus TaxID=48586 RepID=UPI001B8710B0|nr:uncharacterized protein DFJ58DRAFT_799614 [Suillus subalutaceus]KAG1846046.1 hypothetical protein DFJ58DRAFT_799614 [Suillus subalutaceus]
MHFSLLAVIASLAAFMFVSATPAVFSRECTANGGECKESSECCSGICLILDSLNTLGSNLGVVTHPYALCNRKVSNSTAKGFASIRSCYIGVSHVSGFVLELLFMTRFLVTCWVGHCDRCWANFTAA